MDKGTTYVALDDSKRKIVVAILRPGQTQPEQREMPKESQLIRRLFQRLKREGPIEACRARQLPTNHRHAALPLAIRVYQRDSSSKPPACRHRADALRKPAKDHSESDP